MSEGCWMCHDTEGVEPWKHPQTGSEIQLCGYCRQAVLGACSRCGEIIVKNDRYGVVDDGGFLCSRCAQVLEDQD